MVVVAVGVGVGVGVPVGGEGVGLGGVGVGVGGAALLIVVLDYSGGSITILWWNHRISSHIYTCAYVTMIFYVLIHC